MSDPYAQLLDSLGFNAADAAHATGQAHRDKMTAHSQIRLSGEDERDALKASAESRGVLSSGEYTKNIAKQRAREGSRLAQADTAAADRVSTIERELKRNRAQHQLRMEERNQSRLIGDRSHQLAVDQFNAQKADWDRQYQLSLLLAGGGSDYSGFGIPGVSPAGPPVAPSSYRFRW